MSLLQPYYIGGDQTHVSYPKFLFKPTHTFYVLSLTHSHSNEHTLSHNTYSNGDCISSLEAVMGKAISSTGLSRRWRRMRGFQLNSGRFCVLRLRFSVFFKLLTRCSELVRKCFRRRVEPQCSGRSGSQRSLIMSEGRSGRLQDLRSCGRSNSFYAEAIADCLEFIKRSSLSADGNELPATS